MIADPGLSMCIFQSLAQHFEHLHSIRLYALSQQEETEITSLKQAAYKISKPMKDT